MAWLSSGNHWQACDPVFSQAGIRKDVRITSTSIRKMVSDKAYEMSPTKKCFIHHHMKHQERTAESNYVIKLNADRASRAHMLVHDIIKESGVSRPIEQALSSHSSTSNDDDDVPLGIVLGRAPATTCSTQRETPSPLSDEHKSVLLTIFQQEISTRKLLTMQEVRTRMWDSHVLCNFVVQADFVKRVADFVRYKTNATRQIQLTSFPDDDDGIASFTIQSGVRRVWSPHDMSVMEAKFKGQKRAPLKRDILSTF